MKRVLSVLLVVCIILACFAACGEKDTIVGTWSSDGDEPSNYPGLLTLREDGTGSADGYGLNWHTSGNQLTIVLELFGSETYTYKVMGGFLTLDDYVYTRE